MKFHDDVIKWKHFPSYWPFVKGIHLSPVNSPHKGQWRGPLMFSLNCVWTNGWANDDLRRHRAHYDVTVMFATVLSFLGRSLSVHTGTSWGYGGLIMILHEEDIAVFTAITGKNKCTCRTRGKCGFGLVSHISLSNSVKDRAPLYFICENRCSNELQRLDDMAGYQEISSSNDRGGIMKTSSHTNIFRVTCPLWRESTDHR